jgi:hypothetical protein
MSGASVDRNVLESPRSPKGWPVKRGLFQRCRPNGIYDGRLKQDSADSKANSADFLINGNGNDDHPAAD